jgi:glyoxylate reductase
VAGAVDDATATAALYLLIGACRRFGPGEIDARRGVFDSKLDWDGHDPEGKTLGLVGMGGIGRALARRCLAFDMTILYHNRSEWVRRLGAVALMLGVGSTTKLWRLPGFKAKSK